MCCCKIDPILQEFIINENISLVKKNNISQHSIVTFVKCGEIFDDILQTLLPSSPMKEFLKLVSIWQSYGQEYRHGDLLKCKHFSDTRLLGLYVLAGNSKCMFCKGSIYCCQKQIKENCIWQYLQTKYN